MGRLLVSGDRRPWNTRKVTYGNYTAIFREMTSSGQCILDNVD